MNVRSLSLTAVAAAIGFAGALEVKNAYAAEEQFFPLLVYGAICAKRDTCCEWFS